MTLPAVVLSAEWYFADTAAKTSPWSALACVVVVLVVVHGSLLDLRRLHGNAANRAQATLNVILASESLHAAPKRANNTRLYYQLSRLG